MVYITIKPIQIQSRQSTTPQAVTQTRCQDAVSKEFNNTLLGFILHVHKTKAGMHATHKAWQQETVKQNESVSDSISHHALLRVHLGVKPETLGWVQDADHQVAPSCYCPNRHRHTSTIQFSRDVTMGGSHVTQDSEGQLPRYLTIRCAKRCRRVYVCVCACMLVTREGGQRNDKGGQTNNIIMSGYVAI